MLGMMLILIMIALIMMIFWFKVSSHRSKANRQFVQNRSHCVLFQENLLAHIILQLLSLALICIYALFADDYNSLPSDEDYSAFPPPSIALTGSPALRNFLITSSILG